MVGIIILSVLGLILVSGVVGAIVEQDGAILLSSIGITIMAGILVFLLPMTAVSSSEHYPEEYSAKESIEKVDVQNGVYVFHMEDGSQVAKKTEDVVVYNVTDDPGIQYGETYYSWGNFWPGEDWSGREVILYSPSNKG